MSIQGAGANIHEARELASVILEMTDQAYTVAYDLMRETEPEVGPANSMEASIEGYGALLRLNRRGVELDVFEDISSISIDSFVQVIVLDWIKALLVYLARQTKISAIQVTLKGGNAGLGLEIASNLELEIESLESEIVLANIRKQLETLDGSLTVGYANNQTCFKIVVPLASELLTETK